MKHCSECSIVRRRLCTGDDSTFNRICASGLASAVAEAAILRESSRMPSVRLPVAAAVLFLGAAAPSPQQQWKSDIAAQNRAYADVAHAMLKIQDSAYLGEGQSVTLVGDRGKPASWRWSSKPDAQGPLKASFRGGRLTVMHDGKPVAGDQVEKTVPIDRD